jgi:excisionase family DNA binding protein
MRVQQEPWVGTTEVAAHLQKPVSWIHQNVHRVGLPHRRLGRQMRFKLSQVDAWLSGQE